jgi:hypothetical protein
MPVSTVSGRKIVDITVSTFITCSGDWRRSTVDLEDAGDAILEQDRLVREPHDVVVDVAEAIRHLVGDVGNSRRASRRSRRAAESARAASTTRRA